MIVGIPTHDGDLAPQNVAVDLAREFVEATHPSHVVQSDDRLFCDTMCVEF